MEYIIKSDIYQGYAVFKRSGISISGEKFFYQQWSKWYTRKIYAIKYLNKISI